MPELTDYLDKKTLRQVQEVFSKITERTVRICARDGQPILTPQPDGAVEPATIIPKQGKVSESKIAKLERQTQQSKSATIGDLARKTIRRVAKTPDRIMEIPVMHERRTIALLRLYPFNPSMETKTPVTRLPDEFRRKLLQLMSNMLVRLCKDATSLRNRVEELLAFYRVMAKFNEQRSLQHTLDVITKTVVDVMKAKACSVRLLRKAGSELVIRAVYSISKDYLDKRPIPLSKSKLDTEALNTNKVVYVPDMASDPRVVYPQDSRREGLVSGLCAPMIYKGKRVGVLRVFTGKLHQFSWFDKQLLMAVASAAAAAIVNARLYEEAVQSLAIKRQLAQAGEVQRQMLPRKAPQIDGFDIHGQYIPSYELAGDFFDFIELPEDNLGIAVCDVVGKGIRASLLMASIRASLRAHARNVYDMADLLGEVNRDLCADTVSSDFATMFYGVLNHKTKRLTYSCAGHMPPILVRDGKIVEIEARGGMLGVLPDMKFPKGVVDLQSGDVVLAYTDGLSEAVNFAHEEYGRERIEKALLTAVGEGYTSENIIRHCLWDMRRFTGLHTLLDDRTL
ncbi:MAG: SpoIIE family protein phosphatase, partial [Phycisphaerae bacterium]|nr:SpoIIE family protein phosphatase [Phycisphaerae bacterium]